MSGSFEVPTPESPPEVRLSWLALGLFAAAVGIFIVGGVLINIEIGDLLEAMLAVVVVAPGLLWLSLGTMTLLRVTGLKPEAKVKDLATVTAISTACVGVLGAILSLFFWALSRSVWVNEGGDLATAPNDGLIAAIVCAGIAATCLVLFFVSLNIDDSPRT